MSGYNYGEMAHRKIVRTVREHVRRLHDEQRLRSRWQGSNDTRLHHAILREKITRTVEYFDAPWKSQTSYAVGEGVRLSGGGYLGCTTAGVSGGTEPAGAGTDGTVTWEAITEPLVKLTDAFVLQRTKDTYVIDVALFGTVNGGVMQLQYASNIGGQFPYDDNGTQFRAELETVIADNGADITILNVWGFAGRWLVEVATFAEAQLITANLFALTDAINGADVVGIVEEIGWRPVRDDASAIKQVRAGFPLQGDELQPGRFCELRLIDLVGWCVYPLGKCDAFEWLPLADDQSPPDPPGAS